MRVVRQGVWRVDDGVLLDVRGALRLGFQARTECKGGVCGVGEGCTCMVVLSPEEKTVKLVRAMIQPVSPKIKPRLLTARCTCEGRWGLQAWALVGLQSGDTRYLAGCRAGSRGVAGLLQGWQRRAAHLEPERLAVAAAERDADAQGDQEAPGRDHQRGVLSEERQQLGGGTVAHQRDVLDGLVANDVGGLNAGDGEGRRVAPRVADRTEDLRGVRVSMYHSPTSARLREGVSSQSHSRTAHYTILYYTTLQLTRRMLPESIEYGCAVRNLCGRGADRGWRLQPRSHRVAGSVTSEGLQARLHRKGCRLDDDATGRVAGSGVGAPWRSAPESRPPRQCRWCRLAPVASQVQHWRLQGA